MLFLYVAGTMTKCLVVGGVCPQEVSTSRGLIVLKKLNFGIFFMVIQKVWTSYHFGFSDSNRMGESVK